MSAERQVSFTLTLLAAFSLVFVTAMALAVVGYERAGARAALAEAERQVAEATASGAARLGFALRLAEGQAALPAARSRLALLGEGAGEEAAGLAALLSAEPAALSVRLARPDGTLLEAIRAAALPSALAFPGAAIALRHVPPGEPGRLVGESWRFVAADGTVTDEILRALPREQPPVPDPSGAPGRLVVSPLAVLEPAGVIGFTVSRTEADRSVLVVAYAREGIAPLVASARRGAASLPVLFTATGALLGHPVPERAVPGDGLASAGPALAALWSAWRDGSVLDRVPFHIAAPVRHLASVARIEGGFSPPLLLGLVTPEAEVTAPVRRAVAEGLGLACLAFAGGLAAIAVIAARIARPLAALTAEANAIRALDLDGEVSVRSRITELARLAAAMDRMKRALRQYGAFVPGEIVTRQAEAGAAAPAIAERRSVTVLFSDVEGFTTLVEHLPPETLMAAMNAYFGAVSESLSRYGATIDKYIGDSVMALWNAPRPDALHAYWACEGALAARAAAHALAEGAAGRGMPPMRTRFGLHTGEAVVGLVGSPDRMSYTAMGATVNLASRLEGLNKHYGTEIIVSETTARAAGERFLFRPLDLVLVKGATEPIAVFALVGRAGAAPEALRRHARWCGMVEHDRAGRFGEARALLADAAAPDDLVARLYAARLAAVGDAPPPGWSPVERFEVK